MGWLNIIWGHIWGPKDTKIKTSHPKLDFWWFFRPMDPRYDLMPYSRHPMNDYFIFKTLKHVCTNQKFDSMYGWYGYCAQNMWKIAIFCDFWWFFGPLEPRYDPISNARRPINDYFILGTVNPECTDEKYDSMYGWYGYYAKYVLKNSPFLMIFYIV